MKLGNYKSKWFNSQIDLFINHASMNVDGQCEHSALSTNSRILRSDFTLLKFMSR